MLLPVVVFTPINKPLISFRIHKQNVVRLYWEVFLELL